MSAKSLAAAESLTKSVPEAADRESRATLWHGHGVLRGGGELRGDSGAHWRSQCCGGRHVRLAGVEPGTLVEFESAGHPHCPYGRSGGVGDCPDPSVGLAQRYPLWGNSTRSAPVELLSSQGVCS